MPTSRIWFTKGGPTKAITACSACSRIPARPKKHFRRAKGPTRRSRIMQPGAPNNLSQLYEAIVRGTPEAYDARVRRFEVEAAARSENQATGIRMRRAERIWKL